MLLQFGMAAFIATAVLQAFDMEETELTEFTIGKSKLKFKYSKNGFKGQLEMDNKKMAQFIYENVLIKQERDLFVQSNFESRFEEMLDIATNVKTDTEAEDLIEDIVDQILFSVEEDEARKLEADKWTMQVIRERKERRQKGNKKILAISNNIKEEKIAAGEKRNKGNIVVSEAPEDK